MLRTLQNISENITNEENTPVYREQNASESDMSLPHH